MRLVVAVIFSGALFMSSCKQEVAPLPVDQMAEILSDLHMAEAYAQLKPVDKGGYMSKNYDTLLVLYAHIYGHHRADTATFQKALRWYKKNPKKFDIVYEQVLNKLSIRKDAYSDSARMHKDSVIVYNDSLRSLEIDTVSKKIKDSLED